MDEFELASDVYNKNMHKIDNFGSDSDIDADDDIEAAADDSDQYMDPVYCGNNHLTKNPYLSKDQKIMT